jgi:serine protease
VGFSDLGPEIAIAAPGGNCVNIGPGDACVYPIIAATNSGRQGPVNSGWTDSFDVTVGTSFSSPMVAGTAALMVSAQPALTPTQLRAAMQGTARPFPTSGADNGSDPTPVTQCRAPSASVEQLQCYCNTSFCGAGMLDAGAAVSAVASLAARISVETATPTAGSPVVFSSSNSVSGPGRSLVARNWTVLSNGGIVGSFSGSSTGLTASITPSAAGTFTVLLTVTDDIGVSTSSQLTVNVAAAPVATPPVTNPPAGGGGDGGGGGGAMSGPWLLALAAAVLALRLRARDRA